MQKLAQAYAFIFDYIPGSKVPKEQEFLIYLLCKDLAITSDNIPIEQLVQHIQKTNYLWNKKCQYIIDAFYKKVEKNEIKEAALLCSDFIESCPSIWYSDIVNSLRNTD